MRPLYRLLLGLGLFAGSVSAQDRSAVAPPSLLNPPSTLTNRVLELDGNESWIELPTDLLKDVKNELKITLVSTMDEILPLVLQPPRVSPSMPPPEAGEDAQAGTQGEDVAHLLEQDLRCGDVGQREMAPGELDPCLDGQVRQRVGQCRPKALRLGQFRCGARPVALVQRYPG
jgi:hypothetical protein